MEIMFTVISLLGLFIICLILAVISDQARMLATDKTEIKFYKIASIVLISLSGASLFVSLFLALSR